MPADLPSLPWIDAYKSGVDMTLVRENLKYTPTERLQQLTALQRGLAELRQSASTHRERLTQAEKAGEPDASRHQ